MARPFKGTTFWDRVYSHVERKGSCLIFTGHVDDCGYGRINRDGKLVRLHRAVWERDNGAIPKGRVIMHKCDVPACIEPKHLILGTQPENINDMVKKGRQRSLLGERHGMAKLTDEKVKEIRRKRNAGIPLWKLAYDYNVTMTMISLIARHLAWKHVQ